MTFLPMVSSACTFATVSTVIQWNAFAWNIENINIIILTKIIIMIMTLSSPKWSSYYNDIVITNAPEWRQGWDSQTLSPLLLSGEEQSVSDFQKKKLMVMKMLILMVAMFMMMLMMSNYFLTYDLSLTFVSRLEGKPSSTAHSANTLMCTFCGR